jgi:hypothetical protein
MHGWIARSMQRGVGFTLCRARRKSVACLEMYAARTSRWIDVKIKFVEWMRLSLGTHTRCGSLPEVYVPVSASWWMFARSSFIHPLTHRTVALRRPDIRVKNCAYGHNVATLLNPRGVATLSHKYSLTVARHAAVVLAVPSTAHYPSNYKIKIYYLTWNLKV